MISKAAMRVLTRLKAASDAADWDDAEIVCEGRSCFIGLDSISRSTVKELLRMVLIHDDSDGGKLERYSINEEGRAIVADPAYRPKILEHAPWLEAGNDL